MLGGSDYNIQASISLKNETERGLNQASNGFKSFGQKVDALAAGMLKLDRAQNRAFNSLGMVAAAMSGPLMLAAKNAAARNENLAASFDRMVQSTKSMADVIGRAMEPSMRAMANQLKEVSEWLDKLDPKVVQNTINFALWTSGILLTVVALEKFYTMIKRSVGAVLLIVGMMEPWMLVIAGIVLALGLLVVAWDKVQKYVIPVINAIEAALRGLNYLFLDGFVTPMLFGLDILIKGWEKFVIFLAKIPGPQKKMFADAAEQMRGISKGMDDLQAKVDAMAAQNRKSMGDAFKGIFTGEKGDFAKGLDWLHEKLDAFRKKHKAIIDAVISDWDQFFKGMKDGWDEAMKKLGTWSDWGKKIVVDTAEALRKTWAVAFEDMFTGKLQKAKDYFRMFGESIVKMFAEICAQIVAKWILVQLFMQTSASKPSLWNIALQAIGLVASAGGGAKTGGSTGGGGGGGGGGPTVTVHRGGFLGAGRLVYAHGGLNPDEVPAVLQTGEGVVNRRGMQSIGRGGLASLNRGQGMGGGSPVVIIQAWDSRDIARNSKQIETIISNAMRRNSPMRADIRNYR